MSFLKTLFWVIFVTGFAVFAINNWQPVSMKLWNDLWLDSKLFVSPLSKAKLAKRVPEEIGKGLSADIRAALAYAFAWNQRMPPPATLAGVALLMAGVVWALRIKPVRAH